MNRRLRLVTHLVLGLLAASPVLTDAAAVGRSTSAPLERRPAFASVAGRCDATGWTSLRLPGASRSIAMDVAAVDGRATWVVGMHAGRATPRRPWAVRRTVGGWRSVATPMVGSDAGLVAIDAAAGDDAWSVGFRAVGRDLRPVALRWSGGRWSDVSPAWGGGGSATLTDVSVGSGAWAVGYRTGPSGPQPYALHWRSGAWRRHDPSLPAVGFGALTAAASGPRLGTWTAGWMSQGTSIRPAVWNWRGDRWMRQPLPELPGTEVVLTDLTSRGGHLWAVGYRVDGALLRPIALVRRGSAWESVPLPDATGSMLPDALVVRPGEGPILVGGARKASGSAIGHAVATLVGGALHVTSRPAGISGTSHLRAATPDGDRVMSVGWTDGRALILRTCPTAVAQARAGRRPQARPLRVRHATDRPSGRPDAHRASTPRPIERSGSGAGAAATRHSAATRRVVFRDVAARTGLDIVTVTYGGTSLDLNGDGWDDLLISRHQEGARLLVGGRGRFVPAAADPLARLDRHGCASADVDGDLFDEAYCAVGASQGVKFKSNQLLADLTGRRPANVAGPAGVAEHIGRGRGAAFLSLAADGHPDLLVTSDPLRVDGLPSLNRLYRNESGSGFRSVPELGLDLPMGGTCAFSAQLDGRGHPEVIICSSEAWRGARGLHVFRYDGDRYVEATRALGLAPRGAVDAVAADFDGDGDADLAQLSRSHLVVSLQRAGRLRPVVVEPVGLGQAIASGDVNADGHADLYVVRGGPGNAPDQLLVNELRGRAFRSVAIPQARSGGADDVIAIDHDHNGLTDFVVLNGLESAGPIQLIAAFRR